MAFDPRYFSPINGNLSSIPTLLEPRYWTYLTTDGFPVYSIPGYFPDNCGARLGDIVTTVEVDNIAMSRRTTAAANQFVISQFKVFSFLLLVDDGKLLLTSGNPILLGQSA